MEISFISPAAASVGLLALVPVAAVVVAERRSRAISRTVGLAPARPLAAAAGAVAIALIAGLLALAAARPVLSHVSATETRVDAEAIFVLDISRSMLARRRPGAPSRLERAVATAKEVRADLDDLPSGVSSLTNRVLPHLFPSPSENAFVATLERALAIEHPPPDRTSGSRATSLGSLTALATHGFFSPAAKRRVAIVLTDGESSPFDLGLARRRLRGRVEMLLVHVWTPRERVYDADGRIDPRYVPDATSGLAMTDLARSVGGAVFGEDDAGAIASHARRAVGRGPVAARGRELQTLELAPYATLAAFAPLLLLVWRRNLA